MRRATDILIDTNLLVLLAVGLTSAGLIERHKRTKAFTLRDFDILTEMIGESSLAILPNVASETSNLLAFHAEPERTWLLRTLAVLFRRYRDVFVSNKDAVEQAEYERLGVTDAAILCAASGRRIVTTDTALYVSALNRRLDAINFNHLRGLD